MPKKLCSILLALGLLLPTAVPAFAASGSVSVTLPGFAVTLNGTEIDNDYSQYPLIVYKDITYFPMTYYDCRFLGLETGWENAETGLFIDTTGIQGAYHPYTQTSKNAKSAKAQIASFPITVNGQAIDNSKEEYPLLLFRDVTYFPLTWRFCVDEFNWQYSFTSADGLVISSNSGAVKSYGTLLKQSKDPYLQNDVATDGKYVYYIDEQGIIKRASLDNLSYTTNIFQLPLNYIPDGYVKPSFSEQNGEITFSYFLGSATTGRPYYFIIKENGEAVERNNSSTERIRTFGDTKFKCYIASDVKRNNLYLLDKTGNWKNVGSADYIYGLNWEFKANYEGGFSVSSAYYDGNKYLYLPAFNQAQAYTKHDADPNDYSETTGIYRIDITTDETVRITPEDMEISSFKIIQDNLTYIYGKTIYSYNLKDEKTEVIYQFAPEHLAPYRYTVFGDSIYLQTSQAYDDDLLLTELIKISPSGQAETIDEAEFLTDFAAKGDYLIVLCPEISQTPYRLIVIDKTGEIVFKSADTTNIDSTYVVNDTLYYYNTVTKEICSVTLNS